jgi:hypothetical protein
MIKQLIIISIVLLGFNVCQAVDFKSVGATLINKEWKPCPVWDWDGIAGDCARDDITFNRYMIAFNCVPRCGKWSGDRPDIGAFEYVPGQTSERPWGDYDGWPMDEGLKPITKVHLDSVKEFGVR